MLIFQSLKVDNKNVVLAKETEKEWTGEARGKENESVSQKSVEEMPTEEVSVQGQRAMGLKRKK